MLKPRAVRSSVCVTACDCHQFKRHQLTFQQQQQEEEALFFVVRLRGCTVMTFKDSSLQDEGSAP